LTSNAQKHTGISSITGQISFLTAYQKSSPKLPTTDPPRGRFIWNHRLYYQYQYLITERIELNAGLGFNLSYYSLNSGVSLSQMSNLLVISRPLLPLESDDTFLKVRFTNFFLAVPLGIRFYLKENTSKHSQPAFSFQFTPEYLINSGVNARYTIDGKLFPTRSNTSSIDNEIERFYKKTTSSIAYSLRGGVGVKFKNVDSNMPINHLEFLFVYYFTPYNQDLITNAFGISLGWKWYFQK